MASAAGLNESPDFLRTCLVDGDADQERRVHRSKQRAILLSIALQMLIVAALVLLPPLTKGENIASRVIRIPAPPYARGDTHTRKQTAQPARRESRPVCRFCSPDHIPQGIVTHDPTPPQQNTGENRDGSEIAEFGDPEGDPNGFLHSDSTEGPKPPPDTEGTHVGRTPVRRRISEPVQAAMLYHRVEPVYPWLAVQTRREGRVELHAVISIDGSIQSLEAISGDPFFIKSALAAVAEWRYHPTILNGQPVEVDTHITVIYTLSD